MIFPPSQNVEAPILIHLYSQSSPVFVSGLSPHPDPRIKINPGVPSPGTEIAPPFQPSISASVNTTEAPAGITNSLNVEIQGVVDLILSIVQPVRLISSSSVFVNSNQSLSLFGTSPGIILVNFTLCSLFQSDGSVGGCQCQSMLFSCLPVSSAINRLPSLSTARLSGPAILFISQRTEE